MTQLVYRAAKNAAALVYEGSLRTGSTLTRTPTTTQNSVGTIAYTIIPAGTLRFLTLTATQFSAAAVYKALNGAALRTTQTSIVDLYTDTSLGGPLGTTSQASVASITRQVAKNITAVQSSSASLATQVTSGVAHSTFFITLSTAQRSVATIGKGIQTEKTTTQASTAFISGLFHGSRLATLNVTLGNVTINGDATIGRVGQLAVTLDNVTIYGRGTQPGKIINIPQSQMSGQGRKRISEAEIASYRRKLKATKPKVVQKQQPPFDLKKWQKALEKAKAPKPTAEPPADLLQLAPGELAPTAKALKSSMARLQQVHEAARRAQEEDDLAALMLIDD